MPEPLAVIYDDALNIDFNVPYGSSATTFFPMSAAFNWTGYSAKAYLKDNYDSPTTRKTWTSVAGEIVLVSGPAGVAGISWTYDTADVPVGSYVQDLWVFDPDDVPIQKIWGRFTVRKTARGDST
jgi:hypothetical protein